jgi:uncharacterized RDD family membrane protein YckC
MLEQPPLPLRALPPRPQYRPAPPRAATICFWIVFLLFLAGLGFLGMLASTRNSGQPRLDSGRDQILLGVLLGIFAIAAVIAGITARQQRHH